MALVKDTLSERPITVISPAAPRMERFASIDIVRGLVMVFMALDHSRDFLTYFRFEPENILRTWPALFYTRWITHFCAPMFFFLAGTGAFLLQSRSGSVGRVSRFLWTRGLWLIFLEWTVIEYAWTFVPWYMGGVIWSLGTSMIILAALVWLPQRVLMTFGLLVIALHDLFDPIRGRQLGSWAGAWIMLHGRGVIPHTQFFVLFCIVPWFAVMALGYVFGSLYTKPEPERRRMILGLGIGATLLFLVLRAFNTYGNPHAGIAASSPGEWHPQSILTMSIVSFLDLEKYPPSLQFLLMTIGPSLILLAWLGRFDAAGKTHWLLQPLLVFGRVPLFYYVLHLYVIHLLAVGFAILFHQPVDWLLHGSFWMNRLPDGYGHGLAFIYFAWLLALAILYFPCKWFADLKMRKKSWWLSYL